MYRWFSYIESISYRFRKFDISNCAVYITVVRLWSQGLTPGPEGKLSQKYAKMSLILRFIWLKRLQIVPFTDHIETLPDRNSQTVQRESFLSHFRPEAYYTSARALLGFSAFYRACSPPPKKSWGARSLNFLTHLFASPWPRQYNMDYVVLATMATPGKGQGLKRSFSTLIVKHTGQASGDESCKIFKFRSFLQSKSVNSVCKISVHQAPWAIAPQCKFLLPPMTGRSTATLCGSGVSRRK